ncbi:MAG: hypothetical protein GY697_14240, partial [Desulfobacterales bacterium]|nr:hypothetical protein [Desulfobacterales bacterium]
GDNIFFREGDYIVKMSPPVIAGFSYDRQANALLATVTDEGTLAGNLDVKLGMPGYDLEFDFDGSTGKLKAVLPFSPLSVFIAALQVTDRAGQTSRAECPIFGNPDNSDNDNSETVTAGKPDSSPIVASRTSPGGNTIGGNVVGDAGNGMHLVRVCTAGALQAGFYNKGKFIAVSPGSATLIRLQLKDPTKTIYAGNSGSGNRGVDIFYNHYDTSLYEPAKRTGAPASISMTGGQTSGMTSHQKIYYITGYYKYGEFIPANFQFGLGFTTKAVKECRVVERDISSPVIQVSFDSESGEVTGSIHDYGRPLSELAVSFIGRNGSRNKHRYHKQLPFAFKGGRFVGSFQPPSRGEYFELEIRAVDRAGNVGMATIKVVIPQSPPEVKVQVETEKSNLVFGSDTFDINAYMTAEAIDDSEIYSGRTTFWLDGQVLSQFNRPDITPYQGRSSAFYERAFHFEGMYAAKIDEGAHVARFRATDSTGLTAETTRPFEFSLAP